MSGVWNFDLTKFQNLQEARLPILPSFSASPTPNSPILLQTLHLDLYSRHYRSSYDLESLLRYIPQLIELGVENLYDGTSPPSLVDPPIISLPMLRRLRFSNVVPEERRNEIPLLAQIRAPLLEEFDLHYHANTSSVPAIDIGGRAIFDALVTRPRALLSQSEEAPLYSTLRNAGPSVSWIVNVSRGKAWITAEGIGAGRLELHCAAKNDIPRYILQLLATFTLPVDLDLGWCDEDTKFAPWDEVLDATPLLRSFALDCPFEVAQQVMDLLSTKAPSPSSTNPRAPHLANLSYRFKYYSAGSWSEDDVGVAVEAMMNKRSDLFTRGGVLDPPKLFVTGPNGLVFDEVEGRWLHSKDATRRVR
ncbi:hypothetical protein FRC04_008251 [Tulasnella sp. 424]|nr:hypothetical protein FRC04_008251 [Tulasnella sp. 424]